MSDPEASVRRARQRSAAPRALLALGVVLGAHACEGWRLPSDGAATGSTTTSAAQGGSGAGAGQGGAGGSGAAAVGGAGGGGGQGGSGGAPFPTVRCDPPEGALPPLTLELVATGFDAPLGLEVAPGDAERLFVLEKTGRVRVVEGGVVLETPFLDLSDVVWSDGEAGLLALAFHPDYEENGRFFVYYLQYISNGARLQEFRRSDADPRVADPAPVGEPMIAVLHAHIHNGGALEFSPLDGLLYFSLGERGNPPVAQGLDTFYGKILRLDVSSAPYTIPPGNPSGGLPEIWAYGLRNPWRMAFDPCDGALYVGDVGEHAREEINIEAPGDGGHNYGWPIMEGSACASSRPVAGQARRRVPARESTQHRA